MMDIHIPNNQPELVGTIRAWAFWAFPQRPPCQVGEKIDFYFQDVQVASGVVSRVEEPGVSNDEDSGELLNHWKVFFKAARVTHPCTVGSQ